MNKEIEKFINKEILYVTSKTIKENARNGLDFHVYDNNLDPTGATIEYNINKNAIITLHAPRQDKNVDLNVDKTVFRISLRHEFNHVDIIDTIINPTKNDLNLVKNYILSCDNVKLLKIKDNYFSSPLEIDCEHKALKSVFNDYFLNSPFNIDILNKLIKQRITYSREVKGGFFFDVDDLNKDSLFSETLLNFTLLKAQTPQHIFYRESSVIPKGFNDNGGLNFSNDCIVQYINDRKFEGFKQFSVGLGEYKIPYDLCVAITLEFSKNPDIQKIKDLMRNPEYPLQLKDFELNKQLEKYNISPNIEPPIGDLFWHIFRYMLY